MTLSIIVPVYNVEKYLHSCIESILNQTFNNYELILINDGSTDSSSNICSQYASKDSRIIVVNQNNQGLSAARNSGLHIAKGKYVSFVDSDDIIHKDMYSIMIPIMEKYDLDILKSDFHRFDTSVNMQECKKDYVVSFFTREKAFDNFINISYSSQKAIKTCVWDGIYKRETIKEIKFPIGYIYEDGYFTADALYCSTKIAHINREFYYYRVTPNSIMAKGLTEQALKSIDDWKYIHSLVASLSVQLSKDSALRWIKKYYITYWELRKTDTLCCSTKSYYLNYIKREYLKHIPYFKSLNISLIYLYLIAIAFHCPILKRVSEKSKAVLNRLHTKGNG